MRKLLTRIFNKFSIDYTVKYVMSWSEGSKGIMDVNAATNSTCFIGHISERQDTRGG